MIKLKRPICPHPLSLSQKQTYKHPENKKALIDASYGKCMYCESKVLAIDYGDVEHIKPKKLFPDLEHEWENLGFSCRKCNTNKSNKFDPVCPYINPYEEVPDDFMVSFSELVSARKGNPRARITIEDIDLNRIELLEKRREKLQSLEAVFNELALQKNTTLAEKAMEAIKNHCEDQHEYSFILKNFLKVHGF
jgi:hypothetical protein